MNHNKRVRQAYGTESVISEVSNLKQIIKLPTHIIDSSKPKIRQTYGAESVISEGGNLKQSIKLPAHIIDSLKPKQYKIYGLFNGDFNQAETLNLISGNLNYYIVEDLELEEFCELNYSTGLSSIKIIITKNNGTNYTWQDETTVLIQHNLNGIVDYVLRYKEFNRILTTDTLINDNELLIQIPAQLDLQEDDYLELIVYKISEDVNIKNIFTYKEIQIENDNITFKNPFNDLNQIDMILRNSESERVLFGCTKTLNNITILKPELEEYKNIIDKVYVYKCDECKTYNIKNNPERN